MPRYTTFPIWNRHVSRLAYGVTFASTRLFARRRSSPVENAGQTLTRRHGKFCSF